MKSLAWSMSTLAGQLNRLKQVPKFNELGTTICKFPRIMEEVVDFIQKWLKNWIHSYQFIWDGSLAESVISVKYILIATQKDKVIELRDKLDDFTKIFDWDLLIEIWVEQVLVSVPIFIVQVVWFIVSAAIVTTVAKQKELDNLVSTLGENKLKMCKLYMEGTCSNILQVIETKIKNTGGHNIIWIKGSPSVGKSALAASILIWLQN